MCICTRIYNIYNIYIICNIYIIYHVRRKIETKRKTADVLLCRMSMKGKAHFEDIRFRCGVHWWHRRFRRALKTSANRAPALLSLLQDLRTNIVKNTTVTVYELIRSVYGRITARLILIY